MKEDESNYFNNLLSEDLVMNLRKRQFFDTTRIGNVLYIIFNLIIHLLSLSKHSHALI